MKIAGSIVIGSFLFANSGSAQSSIESNPVSQRSVNPLTIRAGALSAVFRDNSESPRILSGIDTLTHSGVAEFDAYDPDTIGASAGLNFEHVISGHSNPANSFTPRRGRYSLHADSDQRVAMLVRKAADGPWGLSSRLKYTVEEPHDVDFEFHCEALDSSLFGQRGYAVLFFANYMNDVLDPAIHFRGVERKGGEERWIRAAAPSGHRDYNQGGTYRSVDSADLEYDQDHNFKLNLWSYDYPRFTLPFYYGRAANGMVFMLMFDKVWTETDEIRFSLFKFKLPKHPRPAWDFQYVIHRVEAGREYSFKGRLVWKKFVSEQDCWGEYKRWQRSLSTEKAD